MRRFFLRAGWADIGSPSWMWRKRFGRWWVWIGPFVLGPSVRSY
jgi:hypothetical protein